MNKILGNVDITVFWVTLALVIITLFFGVVYPEPFASFLSSIQSWITINFGWWFMVVVAAFIVFILWLAFSKYGKIRLGKDDDRPEYNNFSWFSMLFSAGIGVGFIFWGVAEPVYHYMTPPPYGPFPAGSAEAASFGMAVSILHWGIHGWVIYAVIGGAVAYYAFRKDKPMTISAALVGVLGEERVNGAWGRFIDFLAAFATILGISTSLGMALLSMSYALEKIFGINPTTNVLALILVAIIVAYICSAVTGINRGIKWLSTGNMAMAFCVLAFFFIVGPTKFQLNMMAESTGHYLQNFVFFSLFTDAGTESGWLGWWTVFYWCWWIAWGPFVGGFIARISKGRTLREFIIGVMLVPTTFTIIWFNIIGGSAVYANLNGTAPVWDAIQANAGSAIFALLSTYPLGQLVSFIVLINLFIFVVTSADSASFLIAMLMSKGDLEPTTGMRIIWGICVGCLGLVLLLTNGLQGVQTVSIIAALPFSIVAVLMMPSLYKGLKNEKFAAVVDNVDDVVNLESVSVKQSV